MFLEKKNFLDGTISEIRSNHDELKVVIKAKFTDIENESIKDIDKLEELKSFIKDKKTNLTIATFKSKATALNLIQTGKMKIGLVIYNVIKYEGRNQLLTICYSCGKPSHNSKNVKLRIKSAYAARALNIQVPNAPIKPIFQR